MDMIILVRHGKPDYSNEKKLTVKEMVKELESYNQAHILVDGKEEQIQLISKKIKSAEIVFSSELTRAKETALLFFKQEQIIFDANLNEFNLLPQTFITKNASFTTHLIYSRILLMLGKKCHHCETHREAIHRVARVYRKIQKNYSDKKIVIFGHSLFFRYLSRLLRNNGYKRSFSTGRSYLGLNIFTK